MKLKIIQPTHYTDASEPRLVKSRSRPLIGLTLPYLAALTPRHWQVELIEEQVDEIDFDAPVDVVAITTWTINARRAYEISAGFRARGVPVLMGGPHTFFHTEEAAEHCDAVGVGEAELIWSEMLEDAASGSLKPIYRAPQLHDLKALPLPRYELLDLRQPNFVRTYAVQTSRGCPFRCEFCSERFFVGTRYRQRPAEDVVEELKASRARNVLFADSMFAGKKERAMELMEKLVPLKLRWSTLWTTYLCLDDEFMDLAVRSGLLHVNMGMESIRRETLGAMNKRFNDVSNYPAIIDGLRRRGVSFSLNFVFGFEGEKPDVFDHTLRFLERYKVPVAYFYILDPEVGTPLYDRMRREGRLREDEELKEKLGNVCRIRPDYCSPEELEAHVRGLYERFYTLPSMARRLPLPVTKANIASWILNLSQRRMARAERNFENFDWT